MTQATDGSPVFSSTTQASPSSTSIAVVPATSTTVDATAVPILTDLTLAQWADELPPGALVYDGERPIIDLAVLTYQTLHSMEVDGVIDILVSLHRAAFNAQSRLNQSLPPGSKLNAFQSAYTVQMGGIAVSASINASAQIGDNLVDLKGVTI